MPSDKEYYESIETKFSKNFPYELGAFFALFSQLETVVGFFIEHLMECHKIEPKGFHIVSQKLSMQAKLSTWRFLYGDFTRHNPEVPEWDRLFKSVQRFTNRRNQLAHRLFASDNGSVKEIYVSTKKGWDGKRKDLDVGKLKQTNKDMLETLSDLHRIISPPTKKS